jgi:NTP pyrophosphatase (non-canonical NTP hydrolase)
MDFDEYQKQAAETAIYENNFYPIASLMVESAELSDLFIKPMLRGDDKKIDVNELMSEAGDVLWNLAMLLNDNGVDLSAVACYNLQKLKSRQERGVIKGSGGNR